MAAEYSHKDIKVLSEIEHLQKNKSMYIGEAKNPNHLLYEVLDNALDEASAGYAKLIGISIDNKNHVITISDNGRGIPFENNTIPTIATKMFSGGKFDKGEDSAAYKIACLRGNTKIKLLNGKDITIKEMADKPNEEYWILSSTEKGEWKASKALYAQITGQVKKLIRVTLDNNEVVECTHEHNFMMRDGTYKEAQLLQSGDSLMPCYSKVIGGYDFVRPNNTYPYKHYNKEFEKRAYYPLYRIVYESLNEKIPFGYGIHHKDENKLNNYPSNLQMVHGLLEHLTIHNRGEIGRAKSRIQGLTIGSKNLVEYAKSDRNRINKKGLMKEYNSIEGIQKELQIKKILKFGKTLLVNNIQINEENWNKYVCYSVPKFNKVLNYFNNSIEELIEKSSANLVYHDKLSSTGGKDMIKIRLFSILEKIENSNQELNLDNFSTFRNQFDPKEKTIINMFGSFENLVLSYREYENNHKVAKVEEIILDQEEPVYDIHVPDYHNFVIEAGIVIHNSGLHGIGLVAVTALSTWLSIIVYRSGKKASYRFENAKLVDSKIVDHKDPPPFSTQLTFQPDPQYFEDIKFDIYPIRERLKLASVHIEQLQLILIVDGVKEIINCDLDKYFIETLLDNEKSDSLTPIFDIIKKIKDESLHIRFCWDMGMTNYRQTGCVNLLSVDDGTHINMTYNIIRDVFKEYCTKEKLKFVPQDSLIGFRAHTSLMLYKPEYSSQTKEKLSSTKQKLEHLYNGMNDELKKILEENQDLKLQLLSYFDSYRRRQDSKASLIKSKVVTRFSSVTDSKLRDCTSTAVDRTELFITEGSSASGSLIQCRDPQYHGVLGLKGKIPNVAALSTKKDVLDNKEILEMVNALGTGIEPEFTYDTLRYGKIIFACDADADGCTSFNELIYIKKDDIISKVKFQEIVNNKDKFLNCLTLGYDIESKQFIWTSILHIWDYKEFDNSVEVELEDGSKINLTKDHLVLTTKGYIEAQNLTEKVNTISYNYLELKEIKNIKLIYEKGKFCDISTSTGNFVLADSNVVVHNSHINTLLMIVFLKLFPELVKKGNVYIANLPLYGAVEGKRFIPFYTEQEHTTYKQKHPTVKTQRYKGLGEMNPDQLKVCLLDPQRRLTKVTYPDDPAAIFKLMVDAGLKRDLIQNELV